MKISLFYEGLPPECLSEARRGNKLFCIFSPIRRGGVPSGAASFIVMGEYRDSDPHILSGLSDFHGSDV